MKKHPIALTLLALLSSGCGQYVFHSRIRSVPPIFVLQYDVQRYADALDTLGGCSPNYARRQDLDALMATMREHQAAYQATIAEMENGKTEFTPEETAYFATLRPDMDAAAHHAIDCGVLPPNVLDQPSGDAEWWDFSSDDGGSYTPPPYSPPPH